MPVVVIRHGERLDYTSKEWIKTAKRPWDSPLTEFGKQQAIAAGKGLKDELEKHGLPKVTKIFSSPLIRCVETSLGIRASFDKDMKIKVQTQLAETLCEAWYRSWGIVGKSDATWGGPEGLKIGTSLEGERLMPEVYLDAQELYYDNETLENMFGPGAIDVAYPRRKHLKKYCFGTYEQEMDTGRRFGSFVEETHLQYPDETIVFVSHGGPSGACYEYLTRLGVGHAPMTGYTATYLYDRVREPETAKADSVTTSANDEPTTGNDGSSTNTVEAPANKVARVGADDSASVADQTSNNQAKLEWKVLLNASTSHLDDMEKHDLGYAATGRIDA